MAHRPRVGRVCFKDIEVLRDCVYRDDGHCVTHPHMWCVHRLWICFQQGCGTCVARVYVWRNGRRVMKKIAPKALM